MAKYTIRKFGGDDYYSWAVFKDGRPILTGQSRTEARYERDRLQNAEKNKGK